MKIQIDKSHYACNLVIEADNVKIVEDIEKRTYTKDEHGKSIFFPERDIEDWALNDISTVLADMIYYRKADFDSSELIKSLFEKLPSQKSEELSDFLFKSYSAE